MKSFYISCVLLLVALGPTWSQRPQRVPAAPYPITIMQADGTELTIRLHGDENMHFTTTTDGYVIIDNGHEQYYFAKVNCKGALVPSKHKATDAGKRNKKTQRYLKKMDKDNRLKKDIFVY